MPRLQRLRRVPQTLSSFRHGPATLARIARATAQDSGGDLTFETRTGLRITCPNADGARVPIYEVFAEDAYRMAELTAGLPADAGVLDIGGHVGAFSVQLSHLQPQMQIDAYEASTATSAYLQRNVDANGQGDRVRVHNQALAATATTVRFADNGAGSSLNGRNLQGGTMIEVDALPFSEAVRRHRADVKLVKMDVEGAEYDIVLASSPDDWSGIDRVVFEYHHHEAHSAEDLRQFFSAAGFVEYRHEPVHPTTGTIWLHR